MDSGTSDKIRPQSQDAEAGQTNTQREENLDGSSREDAIRESSQATTILSTDRGVIQEDQEADGRMFEDRTG
jgi:hypothetical protein